MHQRSVRFEGRRSGVKNFIVFESSVKFGVPQGSVLGPLLFLICINDLCRAFNMISYDLDIGYDGERVIVPSFVDDTHITLAVQTGIQLLSRISSCLEFVQKWMKLNKLNLNYSKSCFLLYDRSSNYYPWIDRLNIADMSILRITSLKYLGVLIDECLSLREHIILVLNSLGMLAF